MSAIQNWRLPRAEKAVLISKRPFDAVHAAEQLMALSSTHPCTTAAESIPLYMLPDVNTYQYPLAYTRLSLNVHTSLNAALTLTEAAHSSMHWVVASPSL